MDNELQETLKTCRNLVNAALFLNEFDKEDLLPTQLEYLFELCQHIIDEHCVVRDETPQD